MSYSIFQLGALNIRALAVMLAPSMVYKAYYTASDALDIDNILPIVRERINYIFVACSVEDDNFAVSYHLVVHLPRYFNHAIHPIISESDCNSFHCFTRPGSYSLFRVF